MSNRRQSGVTPYSEVQRPRRRDEPMDVKNYLMQQITVPDYPDGYERYGPGNAKVQASGSAGGGSSYGGGNAASISQAGALSAVTVHTDWGISDNYLYCDSQYKDQSSDIANGQLIFSVVQLNNGKPIDSIIEMEIGDFFIPNVDNFPIQLPIPLRIFFKRSTLLIEEMSTQSVYGANATRHHWELDTEPAGISYQMIPVKPKFIFGKPIRDVAQLTFRFRTPSGNLPLLQDTYTVVPLRNTNPARFLLVNSFNISQFDYLVAPIAPTVAIGGGGNLSPGRYRWLITYVNKKYINPPGIFQVNGETDSGIPSNVVTAAAGNAGNLTNIPVDVWSADTPINVRAQTTRRIYRTIANGNTFYFVDELNDNTTTSYTDTRSDVDIQTGAFIPIINNTLNLNPPARNTTGGPSSQVALHGLNRTHSDPAPTSFNVAIAGGGGGLSTSVAGQYQWVATFVDAVGETIAGSPVASVGPSVAGDRALLTNVPIGDTGVLARNIYRTTVGGTSFKYAFTINNNSATTAVDTVADTALGGTPPTIDGTGGASYTVYISSLDINNGQQNTIINRTQGHLATVPDDSTIELTYTENAAIPDFPYGQSTGTGSLLIGYRRIAFPIRFRSLVKNETQRITPV